MLNGNLHNESDFVSATREHYNDLRRHYPGIYCLLAPYRASRHHCSVVSVRDVVWGCLVDLVWPDGLSVASDLDSLV